MTHLLDTNACIAVMRGYLGVRRRLLQKSPFDFGILSVSLFELLAGVELSSHPADERRKVDAFIQPSHFLPFDEGAAAETARVRWLLEQRGEIIGPYNWMLAGQALSLGVVQVTHNTMEFQRLPNLMLEDSQAGPLAKASDAHCMRNDMEPRPRQFIPYSKNAVGRLGWMWMLSNLWGWQLQAAVVATILAGGETALPTDAPSGRLDGNGEFGFVGALEISGGYRGSVVALSPTWVLTAGHNVDLNDDGAPDAGWSGTVHLPGYGSHVVAEAFTHPSFTGFANPSVHHDLALLRLTAPLSVSFSFPGFGSAGLGDVVTLVGFGRSGYGDYGYTTSASLADRRFGSNVIDWLDSGEGGMEVFRYDFDDPSTTGVTDGSLGNDIETIIAPGDSGGPALVWRDGGWQVVGINTFTEGYGGRFGDTGGGALTAPYEEWIASVMAIPEPETALLILMAGLGVVTRRQRSPYVEGDGL